MKTEMLYNSKKDCCGCTACEQICNVEAIKMLSDSEGFRYPLIDENICIDCGLCVKICPLKENFKYNNDLISPLVYAVKHQSDEIRLQSTSGGAFTALYEYFTENKGVVYGVGFDKNNNFEVKHRRATTQIECEEFRGSKYVQSNLNDVFLNVKKDLKGGLSVLFVGTPCQTAGLSSFLGSKYSSLLLIDIVCHAVPSPLIWKEHICYIQNKYSSNIADYQCRSKINGWRGHIEKIRFENGNVIYKNKLSQNHASIFHSRLANRLSCSYCKFTSYKRPSDITIADYWGIENINEKFNDNIGISLLLANTSKGVDYFKQVSNHLTYFESTIDDAFKNNHHSPSKENPKREEFWNDYYNKGYEFVLKKYADYSLFGKLKWHFKKIIRNNLSKETKKKLKHLFS